MTVAVLDVVAETNGSVTLADSVPDDLTMAQAVALLTELVGRTVVEGSVRRMIHDDHPSVRPMLRDRQGRPTGYKKQGNWRFRERDVRAAAKVWPRELDRKPTSKHVRGGVWREKQRASAREAVRRKRAERGEQHGDQSPDT